MEYIPTFSNTSRGGPGGVAASLRHRKKKSGLGPHVKYIVTCHHKKTYNVLSKFMTLHRATFTAILGHTDCKLDHKQYLSFPQRENYTDSVPWLQLKKDNLL